MAPQDNSEFISSKEHTEYTAIYGINSSGGNKQTKKKKTLKTGEAPPSYQTNKRGNHVEVDRKV